VNLRDLRVGVQRYSPDLVIGQLLVWVWVHILSVPLGLCSCGVITFMVHNFSMLVDCVTVSLPLFILLIILDPELY
jgi:hypothetical protein